MSPRIPLAVQVDTANSILNFISMEAVITKLKPWAKECSSCLESFTWFGEDEPEPPHETMNRETPTHRIYTFLCDDCTAMLRQQDTAEQEATGN